MPYDKILCYMETPGSFPVRCFVLVSLTACRVGFEPAVDESIEFVVTDRSIAVATSLALVEPRPAINPWDPDHVVIATIAASPSDRDDRWTCLVLGSSDGGESWTETDLEIDRCIDPWVEFTGPDSLLAAAIAIRRDTLEEDRLGLVAFRSADRGRSWTQVSRALPGFEHPMLASEGDSAMTLVARRMSRASDGDVRHSVYVGRVSDQGDAVTPLGHSRPAGTGSGASEITPTGVARLSDGGLFLAVTAGGNAWALRSYDDGVTFETASLITDACAGGGAESEFAGWPFVALDGVDQRLYHVCVRSGFAGVELRHSADGGFTWSPGVALGTDAAATATSSGVRGAHARTAMVATNRVGVVAVAWHDRGGDPDGECQNVLFTASRDGGESFLAPVRVSSEASCPDMGDNRWVANSWPMGGDYSSLVARPDGDFLLVWADSRTGRFALRYAVLRVSPIPSPPGAP